MSDCCSNESLASRASIKADVPGKMNCPHCGQPGRPMPTVTLKQIVRPEFLELVNKPGFHFCQSPNCDVVYFHPDGDVLLKQEVRVRVGLKETEDPVPICYCFGFTEAMVVEEIRATGKCTIPQRITAEVKAGNCACEIRNPQGSCCLGNVNAAVKRATKVVGAEKSGTLP